MKFLVIQTAFVGDVILATALIEKLHRFFPEAKIDFLVRKGNESLLTQHPFLNKVIVWNKKERKFFHLFQIIRAIRKEKYNYVINLQRFATSGILTILSNGNKTIGFDKNPFSLFFTKRYIHDISRHGKIHEVQRNLSLIESITDFSNQNPSLYPSAADFEFVSQFKGKKYLCMAPASVWFTKQLPKEKWIALIKKNIEKNNEIIVYLIGGKEDHQLCEEIIKEAFVPNVINLAGKVSLLQSAALMKDASMNYVNDSAPMHIASAMNAPVTAFYCSTVPAFGFTPLSTIKYEVETTENLDCRPCGLHGFHKCPEGHFRCATTISI